MEIVAMWIYGIFFLPPWWALIFIWPTGIWLFCWVLWRICTFDEWMPLPKWFRRAFIFDAEEWEREHRK